MVATYIFGKRGTFMIGLTGFRTGRDWQRNRLRTQENGSYSEPRVPDLKSLLGTERWALLRRNRSGVLPSLHEIRETQQISPYDGLSAGMDKWGFVYGLLETPTGEGAVIHVETPSDHWSWCGDPGLTPRICLKKRISILSHFGG
jgi:hypothetical protein